MGTNTKLTLLDALTFISFFAPTNMHLFTFTTSSVNYNKIITNGIELIYGEKDISPELSFEYSVEIGKIIVKQHIIFDKIIEGDFDNFIAFIDKYEDTTFDLEISQKSVACA
jgi:hypothetical protein